MADVSIDLLNLIRGDGLTPGLRVASVVTAEPDPTTIVLEGTKIALGLEVFEIPVDAYPLRVGDRFLIFPMVSAGAASRWGFVNKLTGGEVFATMQSPTSLVIDGMAGVLTQDRLYIPPFFAVSNNSSRYIDVDDSTTESDEYLTAGDIRALQAGDRVTVKPMLSGEVINYVVTNKY